MDVQYLPQSPALSRLSDTVAAGWLTGLVQSEVFVWLHSYATSTPLHRLFLLQEMPFSLSQNAPSLPALHIPVKCLLSHAAFPDFSHLVMTFLTSARPWHLISHSPCWSPQPRYHRHFCVDHIHSIQLISLKRNFLCISQQAWYI